MRGQEHHWTWIRSALVYQVIRIYCRDINGGEPFWLVSYSYYTKLSESWNFERITPLRVLHLKFPYIFLWLSLSMSTMITFMWRNLLRLGEISQKKLLEFQFPWHAAKISEMLPMIYSEKDRRRRRREIEEFKNSSDWHDLKET